MAEEKEFEVVDRRRVRAEEEAAGASTSSETVEEAEVVEEPGATSAQPEADPVIEDPLGEAEDDGGPIGMPGMEMGVNAILVMAMNLLSERAWAALGLVPDPMTGKIEKNLSEARRAIDALADILKHLESQATDAEKRELQGNLSNLRINYVRQAG